jgi:hypothetical protein
MREIRRTNCSDVKRNVFTNFLSCAGSCVGSGEPARASVADEELELWRTSCGAEAIDFPSSGRGESVVGNELEN